MNDKIGQPDHSKEPIRQWFKDYVKPFLNLKSFIHQTLVILRNPVSAVEPDRYKDSGWMSPLTYAVVGCSLMFWAVTAVELAIVHTMPPRAPAELAVALEEQRSSEAGPYVEARVESAKDNVAKWKKDSVKERASIGSYLKLVLPLTFLFGSYVFKFILKHPDSQNPRLAALSHEFHLQYVFAITFLPNFIEALNKMMILLSKYYEPSPFLRATSELLPTVAVLVAICCTFIVVRMVMRTFYVNVVNAWIALSFANVIGYAAANGFLWVVSEVTKLVMANDA